MVLQQSVLLAKILTTQYSILPATIGISLSKLFVSWGCHHLKLQIMDSTGIERYQGLLRSYFKDFQPNSALLAYDMANEVAVDVEKWYKHVPANIPVLLMALKADLSKQRKESQQEAIGFAKAHSMSYLFSTHYVQICQLS